MKYKITYYDPSRWVYEDCIMFAKTKSGAKKIAKELLETYPPQDHSSYIKIEKVELVEMTVLRRKK